MFGQRKKIRKKEETERQESKQGRKREREAKGKKREKEGRNLQGKVGYQEPH